MKPLNTSTKYIGRYSGKWVAIDYTRERIVAAGETLQEIASFVSGKKGEEHKVKAAAFKVPRKNEGPHFII